MWARCRGVAEGVAGVDDKQAGGAGASATCALTLTAVGRGGSNFGGRWEEVHATCVVCERRAGVTYAIAFPERSWRATQGPGWSRGQALATLRRPGARHMERGAVTSGYIIGAS